MVHLCIAFPRLTPRGSLPGGGGGTHSNMVSRKGDDASFQGLTEQGLYRTAKKKKAVLFRLHRPEGESFYLSLLFADGGKPAKFQEVIF